jgi:hypothetical protein
LLTFWEKLQKYSFQAAEISPMDKFIHKFLKNRKPDYSKDDFMFRKDILKRKITLPESSDRILIVFPISDAIGFKVQGWDNDFFRGRVPELKFKNTIRKANSIIQSEWCRKKNMHMVGIARNARSFLIFAIFLAFIGF